MYKRILVPLDGSELAEVVLPCAKEFAGRLGLSLVFLHVCSPEGQARSAMQRNYVEHIAEVMTREAEDVQRQTGAPAGHKAVESRGELSIGYPAEEILRYADENGIDFVIMATHGYSGIKRWALGSVADKVLRASRVPVLLVRAEASKEAVYDKWPRRTLLVTLDGSKLSEAVLPHVQALAGQRGNGVTDVVLLSVCEPPVIPSDYPATLPVSWEEHTEQEKAKARRAREQYLAGVENSLSGGSLKVRSEVILGNPADEIIGYASKNPFSLVVMATHGYSGVSRWAYGSVADKVLHGVSCPLFLIRPR